MFWIYTYKKLAQKAFSTERACAVLRGKKCLEAVGELGDGFAVCRGSGWAGTEEKSVLPVVFGYGHRGKEPLAPVRSSGGLCCKWRVQNSF